MRAPLRALVLACPADDLAVAIAARWRRRHGDEALRIVPLDALLFAPRWEHRVSSERVSTNLVLHDGTNLGDFAPAVVLNRLAGWSPVFAARWKDADRAYAQSEMFALLLSWLAGLPCPVINRPAPPSLVGPNPSPLEWAAHARAAGLRPLDAVVASSTRRASPPADCLERPDLLDPDWAEAASPSRLNRPAAWSPVIAAWRQVHVIGEEAFGAPQELAAACVRLAHACGAELLTISLALLHNSTSEWRFGAADVMPLDASPDRVAAIVAHMERRATGFPGRA
jgi:hypothetical protein